MSSRNEDRNMIPYTGVGLSIGAALGSIAGLLLFDQLVLGASAGAAVGLIIGAAVDAQAGR